MRSFRKTLVAIAVVVSTLVQTTSSFGLVGAFGFSEPSVRVMQAAAIIEAVGLASGLIGYSSYKLGKHIMDQERKYDFKSELGPKVRDFGVKGFSVTLLAFLIGTVMLDGEAHSMPSILDALDTEELDLLPAEKNALWEDQAKIRLIESTVFQANQVSDQPESSDQPERIEMSGASELWKEGLEILKPETVQALIKLSRYLLEKANIELLESR